MEQPICPSCGGEMWDNRAKKASGEFKKTGPDFSCKNKEGCGYVIWPEKKTTTKPMVRPANLPPSQTPIRREPIKQEDSNRRLEIAREAAANALGRLWSGREISLDRFMENCNILAEFYITGIVPEQLIKPEPPYSETLSDEETSDLPF